MSVMSACIRPFQFSQFSPFPKNIYFQFSRNLLLGIFAWRGFFLLTLLLKGDLLGQSKKSLSVCASTTYGILHVFLIQYMFHPDTLWINGEGTLSPFRVPPNPPLYQVCSKQPFVLNRGGQVPLGISFSGVVSDFTCLWAVRTKTKVTCASVALLSLNPCS